MDKDPELPSFQTHSQYSEENEKTHKNVVNNDDGETGVYEIEDERLNILIEAIGVRYPYIDNLAKEMGLTKQKTICLFKSLENTVIFQMFFSYFYDLMM